MPKYSIIHPAMGRDYEKAMDAIVDFTEGTDFVCDNYRGAPTNQYCSIRDFDTDDLVEIRFFRQEKVVVVKINKAGPLVSAARINGR